MTFYEFFAGGGMARLGLQGWTCAFANENSEKKAVAYRKNFHRSNLLVKSIHDVSVSDLPRGTANLAWASFPCQDLSLAGNGAGLDGERSGTFWAFWNLMCELREHNRAPRTIVLENVTGAITSNKGEDFRALLQALRYGGYRYAPIVIDGLRFVPQSRPRLFVIATDMHVTFPEAQRSSGPLPTWHTEALRNAYESLPDSLRTSWIWAHLPVPPSRTLNVSSLLEPDSQVQWHSAEQTNFLLGLMSEINLRKVEQAKTYGRRVVGTLYKRTRYGLQRAEVRFDEISGCLRTPGGGSSRQTLLVVENGTIRSRLITPREAARLMGVPETYQLPQNYNEAYHLMGDGLVVPAVSWLERSLLHPICEHQRQELAAARRMLKGRFDSTRVMRPLPQASRRESLRLSH